MSFTALRSRKLPVFLHLFTGMCLFNLIFNNYLVRAESSSTTTAAAPIGVKKCYKCEGDCNGGPGTVEECHPDSDSLMFACYTILVEGKAFQRGCTLDFSEGENCVKEKGNMYCFCRTDECNKSGGSIINFSQKALTFGIIMSCVVGGSIF